MGLGLFKSEVENAISFSSARIPTFQSGIHENLPSMPYRMASSIWELAKTRGLVMGVPGIRAKVHIWVLVKIMAPFWVP